MATLAIAPLHATSAQGARAAASCRAPDTTAAWYKQQKDLLTDVGSQWTNDTLRSQLLHAAGLPHETRRIPPQYGWLWLDAAPAPSAAADSMIGRLRALAGTRGSIWPTQSLVGVAGARATWLLAVRDTALARVALHRMMEAGQDGNLPADVATLEDRVRLRNGRKQLYGTQLLRNNGVVTLAPLEDSAHVDLRREGAGLPPLAASLCAARSGTEKN